MMILAIEAAAVLVPAAAGVCLGFWLGRRRDGVTVADAEPIVTADDMEPFIVDAAERWAKANRRPEAAGLVADKLRTLHAVKYGTRSQRQSRRWFR